MKHLGMLALGIFVGSIIALGVINTKDWTKLKSLLLTLLGAAFTGVVFGFIQFLGGPELGNALFDYPIGLLLGLMWVYTQAAAENIRNGHVLLGTLHIVGTLAATVLTFALMFSPELLRRLPD